MKIRADEHISPHLIKYIQDNCTLDPNIQLDSLINTNNRGASDDAWIRQFKEDGGDAILTADSDFIKNSIAVKAVQNTGIKIIHLPAQWAGSNLIRQTAFLLLWWERIIKKIELMKPRQCFQPKWNIKFDTDLKQIEIDFEKNSRIIKRNNKKRTNSPNT